MSPNEAELRDIKKRCYYDYKFYAEHVLKIRPKVGGLIPFKFNRTQNYLNFVVEEQLKKLGMARAIILKGRQEGCSTWIDGRGFWYTSHRPGSQAFILAHEEKATNNLFGMTKRFYETCHPAFKPSLKASNAKALIFAALDSGYSLGTARTGEVGRSNTIQFLHASEAAFYINADEISRGLFETVPDTAGTEIFIESTANGEGNWYHSMWRQAEAKQSDYEAIFLPWYWSDEYARDIDEGFVLTEEELELKELYKLTNPQLAWRRLKIIKWSTDGYNGLKKFKQEYPCCPVEAFQSSTDDTFFQSDEVMKSRKETQAQKYGPVVVGVDPARFGDDRTGIIRRQGRVAYGLESHSKKDTMEIVGIVVNIIKKENPARVFVDVGGLGSGIVDRLWELGYRKIVVAINSAHAALNQERYHNKRSEMWGEGKKWLLERPTALPDSDELHADLCSTKYKFDSSGRLRMEAKEDMKKRGVKSSDLADALLLTFAQTFDPVSDADKEAEIAARLFDPIRKRAKARYAKRY